MTQRECRDYFVSLQTNLFDCTHAVSKKDDFFYKEHEPYGVQQKGVHSILLRIHILAIISPWSCPICVLPLLVDETVKLFFASFLEEQLWNFVLF